MKIAGIIAVTIIFVIVMLSFDPSGSIPRPIEQIVDRVNVPNAVTSVYLETRLYDTIFEIIVFSITALGVASLFASLPVNRDEDQHVFGTVTVYSGGLAALSITLFLYVVINGHITPGGGFVGGVVLATGVITYGLTSSFKKASVHYDKLKIGILENISLMIIFALSTLIILFPEAHSQLLSATGFGSTFSGGLIPILNILIGIKVYAGAWKMSSEFINRRGTL
ncbi:MULTISPECIES: MnhB domain-containing protein [unclassified Mesotoga]|uniref:MnhB-like protein, subunit of Na+/H+ antiporter n=3 Tax=Mesotoga infera TaxID=1236046 RepID=A0A101I6B8_9BACT|nr:MnhB domain-containing protein [Mesotoga sp. TolDC]KUK89513.1 MAG: MnhB-like protein, subunit of Na+/H+ antiporter [Mesotoga infera]PZC51790.1 sodium:proton antiporter [Mesotoga sp. TolDC]